MKKYQVIITPDAEEDLNELDDYITFELFAPDTALRYVQDIRERITSLDLNPARFRLLDDEPWHSRGLRRMNARGFVILYRILEEYNEVYVLNVIYKKRDIPNLLKKIDTLD